MITIRKRNELGQVSWEYTGEILENCENFIRLQAKFNRADMPFQDIILKKDDRFVETFYFDRWYNIFEIYDRDDDTLKGWYCNVGRPAVWDAPNTISYIDLALDLWVNTAGVQKILDEDEFEIAVLDDSTRKMALNALAELQAFFKSKHPNLD